MYATFVGNNTAFHDKFNSKDERLLRCFSARRYYNGTPGYARKSGEPLGFCPKEGACASTGAHPLGMTSSHAGGNQPSRCCPGLLCWGPSVRSSGM